MVAQGATGEHTEKPGFGSEGAGRWGSIRKRQVSIRKSPVRIRKSPVHIRAETVSIKNRAHKGRDPQQKKKYHASLKIRAAMWTCKLESCLNWHACTRDLACRT